MAEKKFVGTFQSENQVLNKIDELKAQGYKEEDIYVVTNNTDSLTIVRRQTDVDLRPSDGNWLDRFTAFLRYENAPHPAELFRARARVRAEPIRSRLRVWRRIRARRLDRYGRHERGDGRRCSRGRHGRHEQRLRRCGRAGRARPAGQAAEARAQTTAATVAAPATPAAAPVAPPARRGRRARAPPAAPASSSFAVTTNRYDNLRSGANLHETVLTTANVKASGFGLLFSRAVDGQIYAQPLFVGGLTMADHKVHDVVYVATEHNTVYAFDATDPQQSAPLWKLNVGPSGSNSCDNLSPEIGITATPVIDQAAGVIIFISKGQEGGGWVQRIHAVDLVTGAERPARRRCSRLRSTARAPAPRWEGRLRSRRRS